MNDETSGRPPDGLEQEPTGTLVRELLAEAKHVLADGTRLLRAELETAKAEVRREAKKVGPAAAFAGGGGVLLHAALLMLAVAIGAGLSETMPIWLAFAITAVLFAGAGALLLYASRNKVRSIAITRGATIHNLEEDQRWAKGLTQSARSNHRQNA